MKQLQRLLPPCTLDDVIRSTREQIVETRKATNVPPCKQRTTNKTRWYRNQAEEIQAQVDLAGYIELARFERLEREARGNHV